MKLASLSGPRTGRLYLPRDKPVTHFIICNGPTNALVCNKTLIQMAHIKTLKNHSNMFRSSADHHQGAF
jgi:hypothetical protein